MSVAVVLVLVSSAGAATETPAKTPAAKSAKATTVADAKAAAKSQRDGEAERRAKGSAFEREELDQSVFADEEAAKAEKSSSKGGSLFRFVFGLAVVFGAIFGTQWLLKKWAKSKLEGPKGMSGLIDVVSTTNLAQGRALHLVRVADELVLVGSTEHSISRLGQLDARTLVGDTEGTFALPSATRRALPAATAATGTPQFHDMLEGSIASASVNHDAAAGASAPIAPMTEGPFFQRFIHNLKVNTAR